MADEPDDLVIVMLRNIRTRQDERLTRFEQIESRLTDVEKQRDDYK